MKVFRNEDCNFTALFGRYLHYQASPGRWEDVDLRFRDEGGAYVMDRHDLVVRVPGAQIEVTERSSGKGIRWLTPVLPSVAGRAATFRDRGLDWTYATHKSGLKLEALVEAPLGARTYEFGYQLLGGAANLAQDQEGNLVSDAFAVPRAVAYGADGNVYPAAAWQLLPGRRVAFEFDDSALPAAAFPYVLDPTTTFQVGWNTDDGYVAKTGPTYPPLGVAPGATTVDDTSTRIAAKRTATDPCGAAAGVPGCPHYEIRNALVEWDTSLIPNNAVVSSATARLRVTQVLNADSRNFTADWYAGWPYDSGDYSETAGTTAMSGVALSSISTGLTDFTLTGAGSNVSKTGNTGLRFHISGSQPTGQNSVEFAAYEHATYPDPALIVTYNTPPALSSASDSPDPVTAGDPLTFTLAWSDPDAGDQVRAVVCKTNSISSSGTCPGGSWASGTASATSPASATYTPTAADHGTKTYYAFACDQGNLCTSSISGTFTVTNRTPSISSASDSPDPVTTGNTLTFSVGWVDPGDSVRAVICKTNEVAAGVCPGGAWATGSASTTSPSPAYVVPTPLDYGTHTYFAFACDAAGACSSAVSSTFTVYQPLPAGGVTFSAPETLHSNGAELRWTKYSEPVIPFTRYEVHRSTVANFTPSASTLLTEIRDPAVTSFTDTTAAPGQTFTYKLVVNGDALAQTVTLPAAGRGSKAVQPEPARGTTARITSAGSGCENYGGSLGAPVGASGGAVDRALLSFDLRDIPADAQVYSASLQVRHGAVASAMTVDLHAVTTAWREGSGAGACTGDGATWGETEGGVAWSNVGGDFDPTRAASVDESAGEAAGWDSFDITDLVEAWAAGDLPNLGVMLKARDEGAASSVTYTTDDEVDAPELRPKLTVTYADGSASTGPSVEVTAPRAAADVLRGSIQLGAAATDDRRVDKVEFLVDGTVVGQDTTQPFELTWNSASVANGTRSFTARATDDVGNATTSEAVSATVDNSPLPTVSITSPSGGSSVSGDVSVTANASDDGGVAKVEFLFDGLRFGEDTTAPYEAVWSTLDEDLPAFDGSHVLTAVAYDSIGQKVTSSGVNVTVGNTSGTKYRAGFTTSGTVPQAMTYDPSAQIQELHGIDVTVTNLSNQTWEPGLVALRYRWFAPESPGIVPIGTPDSESGLQTGPPVILGASPVVPGASVQVRVPVPPPTLPPGTARGTYRLQLDLNDQTAGTGFAEKGNQPSENAVVVNNALMASALGREHYYHYRMQEVGAGMTHLMNVANGNSLLSWTPWVSRGRGLSTVLNLGYNSLEGGGGSLIGNNWSLSLSSLIRLGVPLDVHPNTADTNMGRSNRWIEFTDGDGTTHRFEGKQHGDGTVYWEEPAGVHLYLRQYSTTDPTRKWALTRPDRVTFFFDSGGFPTYVEDKNGNRLTFTLENVPSEENPGGVSKRVTRVTDAGGEFFTIAYYSKAEVQKPQIRGKVKTITDQSGSKMTFDYYEDGNLRRITQVGGTTPEGISVPDRSFTFTYTTSSGSGPAISTPSARENPDPKTSPQSTRLYSVRDPRGTETTFAYETSGQNKWKLLTSTNRAGAMTTYSYDIDARRTTVTNPSGEPIARTYKYDYDTDGKVTAITNPRNDVTRVEWTDRHVTKLIEPTLKETRFAYNANGYLTDRWDQLNNRTTLEYQNVAVDVNDVSGKWKAGRGIPHISQLVKKTDPMGTATPGADFEWTFTYDSTGCVMPAGSPCNLQIAKDPTNATTTYTTNSNGTIASIRDANNKLTTFQSYDVNGCPTSILDAENGRTQLFCDADGLLRWIQDPVHATSTGGDPRNYRTYFDLDPFHRVARQSTPKSTQHLPGTRIWSGSEYDKNDNLVAAIGPHYASQFAPSLGSRTETTYDAMDRPTLVKGPDTSGDPAGERTDVKYDKLGRVTKLTLPRGVKTNGTENDFATLYTYDSLDRVVTETAYDSSGAPNSSTRYTNYCYDDPAGDLKWVVSPRAGLATVNCAQGTPPSFTTKYGYDAAHRLTSVRDGLNQQQSFAYDANGNVTSRTNQNGDQEIRDYDQRNALVKVTEPFNGTRTVKTKFVYDGNGNLTQLISPRAWDASPNQHTFTEYVTKYEYDGLNRLVRVLLPISNAQPQQQYIHHEYDANGNLRKTSLPTTQSSASNAEWKTVMTHFDPGWIRSSDDPGQAPRVDFDYFAEGWQKSRTPQPSPGADVRPVTTTYYPDGMVRTITNRATQPSTYTYDANNNLLSAERVAMTGAQTTEIVADYDGFDQLTRLNQRRGKQGNWTVSTYEYDVNGNVTVREDDRTASSPTATPGSGRRNTFSYDQADWLTEQIDNNATSGSSDDRRITNQFFPTGWEKQRVIAKASGSGGWDTKQTTNWTYFANGKLKTLNTTRPSGTIESHTIDYLDGGIYINGNRTSDTFTLDGQNTQCKTSACVATYKYDPRDRLTRYTDGQSPATTIDYELDTVGNVKTETATTGSQSVVRRFEYTADRLLRELNGSNVVQKRYFYDPYGNLDCVTNGSQSASQADCSPSDQSTTSSANLLFDYAHDPLNRLTSYRSYVGGSRRDKATYVHDPLDRVMTETEDHQGSANDRTTNFSYLGLSALVTGEDQSGGQGAVLTDKSYGYDAYGNRITMTNTTTQEQFTYAYETHGSVSALVPQAGGSVRTYGYTPYGAADPDLTQGDTVVDAPLNPYRYSAKRLDPGSNSYDMGARRYGADPGRFLQQDQFMGALSDLGLSLDPLTQNRYALAGGNPISFIEWDGHMPIGNGGGGGVSYDSDAQTREQFYRAPGGGGTGGGAGPAGGDSSLATRLWGGLKVIGGAVEAFVGCSAAVATGWTGVGAVVGAGVCAHGADVAASGFRQAVSGEPDKTFTQQGLEAAGVPEEVAAGVDAGISGGGTWFSAGALRGASSLAARGATSATGAFSRLPAYTGGKTQGILQAGSKEFDLISGFDGPASQLPRGSRGFDIVTKSHVEGHAAAIMRIEGLQEATLYINRVPCSSCSGLLPRMLPQGAELTIYGPNNYVGIFRGI